MSRIIITYFRRIDLITNDIKYHLTVLRVSGPITLVVALKCIHFVSWIRRFQYIHFMILCVGGEYKHDMFIR